MLIDNKKKNKKQSIKITVLAALLFIAATFIIGFGDTNDIPIIKTSGYLIGGESGGIFFGYWLDGKDQIDYFFKNWKRCLITFIIGLVLIGIPITLLFEGRLW